MYSQNTFISQAKQVYGVFEYIYINGVHGSFLLLTDN